MLLLVRGLPAQTTGSLEGTVTDASGAAVANASVVIRNEATGVEVRLATNDTGFYRSPDRPSVPYTIEVDQFEDFVLAASDNRHMKRVLRRSHSVWIS